ncbi:MAG: hypothetical protein M1837_006430 [Sclerophora amabilis]|nr:MAG: hypothetical protein M1837_006430 [Sclerophora amabilis]
MQSTAPHPNPMGRQSEYETYGGYVPRRKMPPTLHHPDSFQVRQQQRVSVEDAEDLSVFSESPFQSPVSATFVPQDGLAPRPPSFYYSRPESGKEPVGSPSQQRRSLVQEKFLDSPLTPTELYLDHADAPQKSPVSNERRPVREQTRAADGFLSPGLPERSYMRKVSNGKEGDADGQRKSVSRPQQANHQPRVDTSSVDDRRPTRSSNQESTKLSNRQIEVEDSALAKETNDAASPNTDNRKDSFNQESLPQSRRDWASDRSPLQKLELTLQDITKEEKRARVKEAELLAQEAIATRDARKSERNGSKFINFPSSEIDRAQPTQAISVRKASITKPREHRALNHESERDPTFSKNRRVSEASPPEPGPRNKPTTYDPDDSHDRGYRRDNSKRGMPIDPVAGTDHPRERGINQRPRVVPSPVSDHMEDYDSEFTANQQNNFAETQSRDHRRTEDHHPQATSPAGAVPKSTAKAPNYNFPPRSGNSQATKADAVLDSKNEDRTNRIRFSDDLHHSRVNGSQKLTGEAAFPKSALLDEWRQAGKARLTASDLELDDSQGIAESERAWWEREKRDASRRRQSVSKVGAVPNFSSTLNYDAADDLAPTTFRPTLYLKCGPLLRCLGVRRESVSSNRAHRRASFTSEREVWRGSVLIVTVDSESTYEPAPTLRLFSQPLDLLPPPPAELNDENGDLAPEYVDPIAGLPKVSRTGETLFVKPVEHLAEEKDLSAIETEDGLFEKTKSTTGISGTDKNTSTPQRKHGRNGERLGRYKEITAARLHAERGVTFWRFNIEVELGPRQARICYRINQGPAIGFWVPAKGESMNMMFYTCNGFSLNINPDQFSGPDPLWRDVLNTHQTRPFHVMIGGGDQIYNDSVMRHTTLFKDWLEMKNPQQKSSAPFTPEMQEELEVFYLERYSKWFSQGLFGMASSQIPMINMWNEHDIIDGFGSYSDRFMSTPVFTGLGAVAFKYYMLFQHQSLPSEMEADEPSWLLGFSPGPYIQQRSRSMFTSLGRNVAFLGLDCRTERMRDEILSEASYDLIFDRCHREIIKGDTKHLIVLLGVPIAYPRMVWLENIMTSRFMDPVKAMGKAGVLGGIFNQFDGGAEILDDLDDHWTAKNHKVERNWFVQELQELAAEKSVRITILGGDVQLAAVGQFYSNPNLRISKDRDHRYMPNVISSAIVNTPPPEMMSDILNKRNKVHHFDLETDEDMIPLFTHDVDGRRRNNKRLLPRRNWCSIREYNPGSTPPPTPPITEAMTPPQPQQPPRKLGRTLSLTRKDIMPGNLFRRNSKFESGRYRDGQPSTDIPAAQRNSTDGYFPLPPARPTLPNSAIATSVDEPPQRPNPFRRQTTDLLEGKQKRKYTLRLNDEAETAGGGGGMINLEGGLDIVLNLEVNRKDPAGITTPYRLLVPALWYEGPPDVSSVDLKEGNKWMQRMPWNRKKSVAAYGGGGGGGGGFVDDALPAFKARPEEDSMDIPEPSMIRRATTTGGGRYGGGGGGRFFN